METARWDTSRTNIWAARLLPPSRECRHPFERTRPTPPYTKEAQRAQIEGKLTLRIVVDPQGNVAEVKEISPPLGRGLDENAIETVKTWKFEPAKRGGVPVSVRVMVEVSFHLYYGPKP